MATLNRYDQMILNRVRAEISAHNSTIPLIMSERGIALINNAIHLSTELDSKSPEHVIAIIKENTSAKDVFLELMQIPNALPSIQKMTLRFA